MENNKQKYEGSSKITHHALLEHREYSESKFIMDFFKSIPIEKLKELISFEVINPYDNKRAKSFEEAEHINILREMDCVEYKAKMIL